MAFRSISSAQIVALNRCNHDEMRPLRELIASELESDRNRLEKADGQTELYRQQGRISAWTTLLAAIEKAAEQIHSPQR